MQVRKNLAVGALACSLLLSAQVGLSLPNDVQASTVASVPNAPTGNTFYVSKTGSNAGGRTWAAAWNELNQINWSTVLPGDSILLDGGSSQMVYNTTLNVTKSGTSGAPITIKLAPDAGRNGQAVVFGGRNLPLPYCDQPNYTNQTTGVNNTGIELASSNWVVVDGTKWSGILVKGNSQYGVHLSSSSSNNVVRNVEITDNGKAFLNNGLWRPDMPGVGFSGSNNVFERALIHDNGQDAFQSGGGVSNFTVRQSWLYNSRPHPSNPSLAYNFCRHSDGLQVYNGGVQSGVTIDSVIIGPGLMQGTILGQALSGGQSAQIDNVTISNVLILDTTNANLMGYPTIPSRNWNMQNITSFHVQYDPDGSGHMQNFLEGSGHQVKNSIFYGGNNYMPGGAQTSGNVQYNMTGYTVGTNADPQFVGAPAYNSQPTLQDLINGNYAVRAGSPATGKGSAITSVSQLLGSAPPPSTPAPTSPPAATSTPTRTAPPAATSTAVPARTNTPAATSTRTATAVATSTRTATAVATNTPVNTPAPSATAGSLPLFEAEAGNVKAPFQISGGSIYQPTEIVNPAQSGRASYTFSVPTTGDYVVNMLVSAPDLGRNSVFLNVDGEPTNQTMAWDIPVTNGYVYRTAGWRGNGTPDVNQYTPKVFRLTAGTHTLVIKGRERGVMIDKVRIDYR
ncbi:MAG: right-handed parallel beta-helix repeat-containing protein [Chloroflexota bacterium]